MIGYHIRKAFSTMRNTAWLTVMTIGVIAVAFLLLGGFFMVSDNLSHIVHEWSGAIRMHVFLQADTTPDEAMALAEDIRKKEAVHSVLYVGPEEAKKNFIELFPNRADILEGFSENPLPPSLEIDLETDRSTPATLATLADELSDLARVEDIVYGQELFDKLSGLLGVTRLATWTLGGILSIVVVFLIGNTFRLTLYGRRDEIEVLLLVGATHWFIRWPFFIEGMIQGLLGAVLSLPILFLFFMLGSGWAEQTLSTLLPQAGLVFVDPDTIAAILLCGFILGGLGSLLAVNGFLRRLEEGG